MAKKKIRKKFNILKFFIFCLIIYIFVSVFIFLCNINIKNIIVSNNYYLTEEEIIETAKLENYPSFFRTTKNKIRKNLIKNNLIEDVKIEKKLGFILNLKVIENKILYKRRSDDLFVLNNKEKIKLNNNYNGIPILINYVPNDLEKNFIDKMKLLDKNIILKISEIEYSPSETDQERFIFYMNDLNHVFVNITSIKNMNKYNSIVKKLNGNKGILYLDSGNYFEIKE